PDQSLVLSVCGRSDADNCRRSAPVCHSRVGSTVPGMRQAVLSAKFSCQLQYNRAVIRAVVLVKNLGALEAVLQCAGSEEIVQAPSDVLFTCAAAHAPPAVFDGVRIKMSEGVDVACVQQTIQAINLDLGITGTFVVVGLRACNINRAMADVEVTADHNRFVTFQLHHKIAEIPIP